MATVDLSKLSYAELEKLVADATALKASKRDAEITAFVDKTVEGADAIGLSLDDLIKALQPRAPKSGPVRAKRGTAKKTDKVMPERGATYKHPETGETYTRSESGKGRVAKWLQDLVDAGGTFEQYKA
jgi:DNA-binding protein H-NS